MSILIFITGGTFDKEYNEITGQLYFKDTHMQELLNKGRNKVPVKIRTLMMIDSLEMTAADRELIIHQCIAATEDKIIITHGTDTMTETAAALSKKISNKTIVLTGAMIPIKFGSSDIPIRVFDGNNNLVSESSVSLDDDVDEDIRELRGLDDMHDYSGEDGFFRALNRIINESDDQDEVDRKIAQLVNMED